MLLAGMTYLEFHLLFNLPLLLVLVLIVRRRVRRAHLVCICAVALIAFLATTPWDNVAVARGIWDFDWQRVTPVEVELAGRTWRLPAEEYAFFVIETLVVGLLVVAFLPRVEAKPKIPPNE